VINYRNLSARFLSWPIACVVYQSRSFICFDFFSSGCLVLENSSSPNLIHMKCDSSSAYSGRRAAERSNSWCVIDDPYLFYLPSDLLIFTFWVDLDENSSLPVCESLHTWAACIYELSQFASWSSDFYCYYSSILSKNWFLVLPSSTQQITTLTMSIHKQCLPVAGCDFLLPWLGQQDANCWQAFNWSIHNFISRKSHTCSC
jgi:hypothetical protein